MSNVKSVNVSLVLQILHVLIFKSFYSYQRTLRVDQGQSHQRNLNSETLKNIFFTLTKERYETALFSIKLLPPPTPLSPPPPPPPPPPFFFIILLAVLLAKIWSVLRITFNIQSIREFQTPHVTK